MGTVAKNVEHNRQIKLALQHRIIGKIKSIIGWCLIACIVSMVTPSQQRSDGNT